MSEPILSAMEKLERERDEARELCDELAHYLEDACDEWRDGVNWQCGDIYHASQEVLKKYNEKRK